MSSGLKRRLYSEPEAAVYLNRTIDAMKKLRYRGQIKFVKIGRKIQYDIDDLDQFIETHKTIVDY